MYRLAIKESLDKKFKKLQKKDKEMLRLIDRKVQDILDVGDIQNWPNHDKLRPQH